MMLLPRLRGAHVLLVSHQLDLSGGPLFLTELGGAMVRSGADVRLVNLTPRPSTHHLATRQGIGLCSLPASFAHASRADLVLVNTAVAKTWIREWLTRDPAGAVKLVWWIHEIDTDRFARQMDASGAVAALLFDSHASLRQWQSTGLRLPPLARVLHLSVSDAFIDSADETRFPYLRYPLLRRLGIGPVLRTREAIRRALGVGRDEFLLALFGYYAPEKGQDLLMRTVGRLLNRSPDLPLKVLLAGFGVHDRRQFLAALTPAQRRATGGRRRVWYTTEDLRPLYAASDAYVMNSQRFGENFGRVTTEAMAFRLPVLGTNLGGTPEIVVDGVTGLLHPPGEDGQAQLADHIERLVRDRALARRLGLVGRARVCDEFREARFYTELRPVLDAVLDRAGRGTRAGRL